MEKVVTPNTSGNTPEKYYVEIVEYGEPEKVVKRMGPMSERRANQVDAGANINLSHEGYFTRVVKQ